MEAGEADSARVAALVPAAVVHPAVRRFATPVAPLLAARLEGGGVPSASEIAGALPRALNEERGLAIETFGSPFSPLNDTELQMALIRELGRPCVLISSTTLGTIG